MAAAAAAAMVNTFAFASPSLSTTFLYTKQSSSLTPRIISREFSSIGKTSKTIACFLPPNAEQLLVSSKELLVHDNGNVEQIDVDVDVDVDEVGLQKETLLYSFNPLPFMLLAAIPGADTVRSVFGPFAELVKTFNLPDWLIHWGHPGNMAVVLFAMGGYGTYLGFRIKFSDNVEEKAKAKDLHPKLLAGMFFFFALGATGGVISLLTSDRPIFESPHAVTGLIGLALLTAQTALPTLFEGNPGLRNVHGILGSGIMTLFLVHAALGLQLGLTY